MDDCAVFEVKGEEDYEQCTIWYTKEVAKKLLNAWQTGYPDRKFEIFKRVSIDGEV